MLYAFKTGIYVIVHNQSNSQIALPTGINIQTGFRTYIGVDRMFRNKLADPYSNCLIDLNPPNNYAKVLFSYFKQLNVNYYDQVLCLNLCFQDKLINQCNCSDVITPKIRGTNYCVQDSEVNCLTNFNSFYTNSNLDILCDYACPQKCNTISYSTETTSKNGFPTLNYVNFLVNSDDNIASKFPNGTNDTVLMDFARNGLLKIVVNYNHLYYNLMYESPTITANDFFGNVGGQLVLFMGISILSFLEILELLFTLFWVAFISKVSNIYTLEPA